MSNTIDIIHSVTAIVGDVAVLSTAVGGLLSLLGATKAAAVANAVGIDIGKLLSSLGLGKASAQSGGAK